MGESNLAGRLVRVDKAWYGLKESNRIFTEDFKTVLAEQGYVPSTMDSQVYIPACPGQGSEILLMHVDDGLLFYRDEAMATRIIEAMRARYGPDMTVTYGHVGTPICHAGHVFTLHEDHLEIHQRPHIEKCLEAILGPNYEHIRPRTTPASKDLFVTDKHAAPLNRKELSGYIPHPSWYAPLPTYMLRHNNGGQLAGGLYASPYN